MLLFGHLDFVLFHQFVIAGIESVARLLIEFLYCIIQLIILVNIVEVLIQTVDFVHEKELVEVLALLDRMEGDVLAES